MKAKYPTSNYFTSSYFVVCVIQYPFHQQVVETPLLHPERFVNLGIEPPKGVLLYGPPGTGKTLCARAVANRTDACFIRVIGSELVSFVFIIHLLRFYHSSVSFYYSSVGFFLLVAV
jgi:hypothetical protein